MVGGVSLCKMYYRNGWDSGTVVNNSVNTCSAIVTQLCTMSCELRVDDVTCINKFFEYWILSV